MGHHNGSRSFITGLVWGGLAGTALGLLMAPRSGEETRIRLRDQTAQLRERAFETAEQARTQAQEMQQRGREMIDQGRERVARTAEAVRRTAEPGNEPGQGGAAG